MKRIKRTLAILMAVILIIGTAQLAGLTQIRSIAANSYKTGDKVYFGSYPQSKVTDSATLAKLNAAAKNWKSYNYMSGTGSWADGKMIVSDYMQYADINIGSSKYRAVQFSKYRPDYTFYSLSASNSTQDDNGYYINNVYYFKYEPLQWRILDENNGLIMSEKAIDSQAYNNYMLNTNGECWGDIDKTYYASNWANSSIRIWLNHEFYNTAFSNMQKSKINTTYLENKSISNSKYNSENTNDNIFLLSYWEVLNSSYGFNKSNKANDSARQIKTTDYALSQGCGICRDVTSIYNENTAWWLRSPDNSYSAVEVTFGGVANDGENASVAGIRAGIVPALRVDNVNSLPSTPDEPVQQGKVHSVKVDDITLNYKDSATLRPVITADKDVKYTVKYESSNTKVATVDDSGNVYAAKKGTAEIKVTVTDEYGNTVTDTCTVTVKHTFIQIIIIVVLFGWIWY